MNDQISWDASLVKKFSSSNHFKLLNQLRTEVKKYPLNNKKNNSSSGNNESKANNKNNSNSIKSQNISISNNENINSDIHKNKSTVSFNNSKNFSIYNNNNDTTCQEDPSVLKVQTNTCEDSSSSTFKDRLNKIDMK
tara:strand:+ start:237 stop:647 length:411 start_codon:yes stop_codon:yes gene_type:complete